MTEDIDALVIGAGPAGLMAAEVLAFAGHRVLVAEAKPSIARKLLMAGKSGLNLTKDEPLDQFIAAYAEAADWLAPMIREFGPAKLQEWARGLGQDVFIGSTGRVFPLAMKASPLLRAWATRLASNGVSIRTNWRFMGWQESAACFGTLDGRVVVDARATVLGLGGASWSRLGSDGKWAGILAGEGVAAAPFAPANMGVQVAWSPLMERHFGAPVKGVALEVDGRSERGEFVISRTGLEGGGIYAVSRPLREGRPVTIDLTPDLCLSDIVSRLAARPRKVTLSNHLRRALNLDPVRIALLNEFVRPLPEGASLAPLVKALPIRHSGPVALDKAISVAGGVRRDDLTGDLMLKARPGVFCAGEMLDWEAPTGGYLLTACLATGRWAGRAAAGWIDR